ncbi:AAA family ATPase [Spirulina sp. CS-785/01]|uniref:AAA family ATPase n=1 Tax=Spirulina sp. CS-785/01 TaxID=3021716 RepID=UPI00232F80E9|nr:ATP-binding protein [Spirulina sp. CS-785/01]MDB9315334.1 AAA family ATPase [Spirulina sp. CS-785/01]
MLKKVYINNYKCLVNFNLILESNINIFLGKNGSGKTTFFEVLQKIRDFVSGDFRREGQYYQVPELFTSDTLTRWQSSPFQNFELEIETDKGIYTYKLTIEYTQNHQKQRMCLEELFLDDQPLFKFKIAQDEMQQMVGQATIYNDNPSHSGAFLPVFDWSRSGVNFVYERPDNQKLTYFKKWLSHLVIVHPNPLGMKAESRQEEKQPNWDMSNFAAWYSYLSQEHQSEVLKLTLELRDILQGFDSFSNVKSGDSRFLEAIFHQPSKASYRFDELSDGQKALIALYSIISVDFQQEFTLCIDEPENFLALPEIQPWLQNLFDQCQSDTKQAILISHHPSLINYLAEYSGYWFDRQNNEMSRVIKIEEIGEGISLAKLIELGWIYDE